MSNLEGEDKNFTGEILDFFKDLVIIVIIVKLTTIFLVSIFIINGQSMYSSYYDKEFILVDRFSTLKIGEYKKQDIKRGDVVVFEPQVDENKKYFIKRVIGLPGEELKIEDGKVYLKKIGETKFIFLDEKYLNKENYNNTRVGSGDNSITYKIPKGKYFVMGDNRNHSSDSRACFVGSCSMTKRDNYISSEFVIGKVLVDFGYFNYKKFSYIHPDIKEDGEYISTKPKWLNSQDSYSY